MKKSLKYILFIFVSMFIVNSYIINVGADGSDKYYAEVENHTNYIKEQYEGYKIEKCIEDDIVPSLKKCWEIYDDLNEYMDESKDEVDSFIKSGYVSKKDSRVENFSTTLMLARDKWSKVKKELEEKQKQIDDNRRENAEIEDVTDSIVPGGCFVCGETYIPVGVSTLTRNIFNLIKVLVPVIIIITGMIDLLKAVIASDEKKMDEVKPKLIRRIISGITIFLILSIVQFVFKNLLVRNDALDNSMLDCVNYFIAEKPVAIHCPSRKDTVCKGLSMQTCSQVPGCKWNGSDCVSE